MNWIYNFRIVLVSSFNRSPCNRFLSNETFSIKINLYFCCHTEWNKNMVSKFCSYTTHAISIKYWSPFTNLNLYKIKKWHDLIIDGLQLFLIIFDSFVQLRKTMLVVSKKTVVVSVLTVRNFTVILDKIEWEWFLVE